MFHRSDSEGESVEGRVRETGRDNAREELESDKMREHYICRAVSS